MILNQCTRLFSDNDEDKYQIVLEDDIIDTVFVEYNKLMDEYDAQRAKE